MVKAMKMVMKTVMTPAMKAMKPAAKAMKAAKVMKAMKAKKIGMGKLAKVLVFKGAREKTSGGLKAKDLTKNKKGKVVNKKRSAAMKNNAWNKACTAARKALGLKGFVLMNKGPDGKAFYAKAKELYSKA